MKSKIALIVAIVMAVIASATVLSGCSKHEAELSETNAEAMAALESYFAAQEEDDEIVVGQHEPDPNEPILEMVSVYVPKKDGSGLAQVMDGVENITPEALFEVMTNEGLDMSNVEIKSWKTEGPSGTLEITSLDDKSNKMQVCLVNTLTENFGLDYVTVIADGETLVENGEWDSKYKEVK